MKAAKLSDIRAVLFDLDGTLIDTAPDLGYALNLQRARHGLPALPDAVIRPQASHGARGLLGVGFASRRKAALCSFPLARGQAGMGVENLHAR